MRVNPTRRTGNAALKMQSNRKWGALSEGSTKGEAGRNNRVAPIVCDNARRVAIGCGKFQGTTSSSQLNSNSPCEIVCGRYIVFTSFIRYVGAPIALSPRKWFKSSLSF